MRAAYVNLLGVHVSAVNMHRALAIMEAWIAQGETHYVCVMGVHGVMESQQDRSLGQIHNAAGLVTPDGMPLVWFSRLRGFRDTSRVYGPDLMLAMCGRSLAGGYWHYFYGGGEGVSERLSKKLQEKYPGLQVVGAYSPPYRELTEAEDTQIVNLINGAAPHIVWVGLNTPKQERWMATHRMKLTAPVLIGVGAAFDFHAGLKKQAPRWMQHSGLAWLFRLGSEPRRLWRRYLINNPKFIFSVALQLLGIKKYCSIMSMPGIARFSHCQAPLLLAHVRLRFGGAKFGSKVWLNGVQAT
jgi:N-acetylglucosaminyldiphosphoundecaprenol N-acetyl-beta-D-mannosaminyltransferase